MIQKSRMKINLESAKIGLSCDIKSLLSNSVDKKLKMLFLPFLFHYNIIFLDLNIYTRQYFYQNKKNR